MKINEILEYYKHHCYTLPKWYIGKFFHDRKKKEPEVLTGEQVVDKYNKDYPKEWAVPTVTTKHELLPSLSAWNVENNWKYASLSGTYVDNEFETLKKECSVYPQFKNIPVHDNNIKLPQRPKTTNQDKELKELAAIYDDITEKYKATNEKE